MTQEPGYGLQRALGYYRSRYEDGFARIELDLDERHMNRVDIPHGGIYGILLDSALGSASSWADDDRGYIPSVTINLNINFIGVPRGKRLIAEGRRIGGGKSTVFADGKIQDETGLLIATATGTFRLFNKPE